MKKICLLAVSLVSIASYAQQPPMPGGPGMPPGGANATPRLSITTTEIADIVRQADAASKAGTQYRPDPLLQSGPFRGGLEYHDKPATTYSVHVVESELFVVLEGSGTMTMGGTLVNPTGRGNNLSSATVEGASQYKLAKGDMLLVPAGTPHAVTQVDGRIALMSMHLPMPPATPAGAGGPPAGGPPAGGPAPGR